MADDYRYGGGSDRDRDRGYGSQSFGSGYDQRRDHDDRYRGGYNSDDRSRGGFGAYSQERRYDQAHDYGERLAYGPRNDRQERPDDRYGNRDPGRPVAIDETDRLIASNKVEGTRVYNRHGDRLGTIYNFMVDKRSGRVEYAVMSFGGFLGLGERYYPLPWNLLTYNERQGGYVVDLDEGHLQRAPSFGRGDDVRFDRGYRQHVNDYYGVRI
jgi:sporulation protein YlmC with PRC-barrel domain